MQPRHRYGRRRGRVPAGDRFLPRLGPAGEEPFAALDDPEHDVAHARPEPATPIDDLRFVALDCETTGQSPHHLVELGAVAFTVRDHLMSFETLVHSNDRINPYARRIHGIASENLHGAPPVSRVVERFRRFTQGAVLVEHSADAFDTRLIARTIGAGLDADNLDTTRLAAKLFDFRDTIGLERLCRQLDVPHRRPHHALADAEATAGCFLELLRQGRERFGWKTLGDLLEAGQPPLVRVVPPDEPGAAAATDGAPRRTRRSRRGGRSAARRSQRDAPEEPPAEAGE
ncbi:MAG: 3'-5' exonuclease [Chloroflexi bacterium]|nr:MAG: 3'-5' exonuclease [Chloroflexota bacterium]